MFLPRAQPGQKCTVRIPFNINLQLAREVQCLANWLLALYKHGTS